MRKSGWLKDFPFSSGSSCTWTASHEVMQEFTSLAPFAPFPRFSRASESETRGTFLTIKMGFPPGLSHITIPTSRSSSISDIHICLQLSFPSKQIQMATERTVAIWESPYDLRKLGDNGFDFCIAKSVIDSTGKLTFNMVWQSKALGPIIDVSWTTQYALNWTVDVPTGGARVKEGGFWHPCNPGDVFDLDKTGLFHPSTVPAKAGFLKLGNNGYQYPGKSGIHVIVGVKNLAGKYDAVSLSKWVAGSAAFAQNYSIQNIESFWY